MNERIRPTGTQGGWQLEGWTVVSTRGGFRLIAQNPGLGIVQSGTTPLIAHFPGESMGLLLALTYATAGS